VIKFLSRRAQSPENSATPQFISVLSGKGGVGKSVIAMNLADLLTRAGHRTLLVDADFSTGDLHILANRLNRLGVAHLLSGELSLREAITSAASSFDLLAASYHADLTDRRSVEATAMLMEQLRLQSQAYAFVIIDHGSGVSDQAAVMAHASDLNILVLLPELTSIADAFGLCKHVLSANASLDCRFIVNRVLSAEEADYIRQKFTAVTDRFLGVAPEYLGAIPEDLSVRIAIAAQAALVQAVPEAPATLALQQIDNELVDRLAVHGRSARLSFGKTVNETTATADIRG
jgi:flagellar biosynthesis protein FlhG